MLIHIWYEMLQVFGIFETGAIKKSHEFNLSLGHIARITNF